MNPIICSALIQFYKKVDLQSLQLTYQSNMTLYSISRARVQYLGAAIPLFRYKHSLFEALISAIHERDIRPNFYEDNTSLDFSTLLQEPISHEKFLVKKFLEFMNNPFLR